MENRHVLAGFLALSIVVFSDVLRPRASLAAVPGPSPSASVAPCEAPDPIGPEDAFGHVVDDPRTLAFLAYVENLGSRDRADVLNRARTPLPAIVTDEIKTALDTGCFIPEVAFRSTRLGYMIVERWSSSDDAIALGPDMRFAIAALVLAERVSSQARAATLAIFGTSEAKLDALVATATTLATPSPDASPAAAPCGNSDAEATLPFTPPYPQVARIQRATGKVQLKVALDAHGYVRSVTIYKREVPDGLGGEALVTAATLAAAVSGFRPQMISCEPIAGTYIFRADFTAR